MESKIKKLLLCLLVVFFAFSNKSYSQTLAERDSLLFRETFWNDPIYPYTDLQLFKYIYEELAPYLRIDYSDFYDMTPFWSIDHGDQYGDMPLSTTLHVSGGGYGACYTQSPGYIRARNYLQQYYDSLRAHPVDHTAQKERLVRKIEHFDSLSYYKPIFFADIKTKYKNDVRKYVDDLFEKSMMVNPKRLFYFLTNPRRRKLKADMGYQFTLSLALYDLWIKQEVRKIKDKVNDNTKSVEK